MKTHVNTERVPVAYKDRLSSIILELSLAELQALRVIVGSNSTNSYRHELYRQLADVEVEAQKLV